MSRGQKNLLAKMRSWFPFAGGRTYLAVPLGQFIFPYKILSPVARVPLRKPGDILRKSFYPADFGGANFSVPWTMKKVDFAVH